MPMVARPRIVQVAVIFRTAEEVIFVSTGFCPVCDPRREGGASDTGETPRLYCPKLRSVCGGSSPGEVRKNASAFPPARSLEYQRIIRSRLGKPGAVEYGSWF